MYVYSILTRIKETIRLTETASYGVEAIIEEVELGRQSIPALEEFLKHEDALIRLGAALVLKDMCRRETIPCLVEALKDADARVARKAEEALEKLGIASVHALSQASRKREYAHARQRIRKLLGRIQKNALMRRTSFGVADSVALPKPRERRRFERQAFPPRPAKKGWFGRAVARVA